MLLLSRSATVALVRSCFLEINKKLMAAVKSYWENEATKGVVPHEPLAMDVWISLRSTDGAAPPILNLMRELPRGCLAVLIAGTVCAQA